jgi:DNA-binding NarL/FixJ family response regulator
MGKIFMGEKKTILIVDDHPLFREGLVSLLSKQSGFKVIGEATEGEEGVSMARKHTPDLVIMDISLPDIRGTDATRYIRESLPHTKVIMLSIHSKIDYITDAFKAGASAYLTKETTGEKLVECLQTVVRGEYYMDSVVSQSVVKNLLMTEEEKGRYQDPTYGTLTPREQEIMRLIAEGFSTKQIAEKLFISQKTVENHRTSIFSKLDIHSTIELVRYAAKYGLIDVDLWKV